MPYDFAREKHDASQNRYTEFDGPTRDEIESDELDPYENETDIEDDFTVPPVKRTAKILIGPYVRPKR